MSLKAWNFTSTTRRQTNMTCEFFAFKFVRIFDVLACNSRFKCSCVCLCSSITEKTIVSGHLFGLTMPSCHCFDGCFSRETLGEDYMDLQNIDYDTQWDLWQNIVALAAMTVGFLAIGYIQLRRIKKYKWTARHWSDRVSELAHNYANLLYSNWGVLFGCKIIMSEAEMLVNLYFCRIPKFKLDNWA